MTGDDLTYAQVLAVFRMKGTREQIAYHFNIKPDRVGRIKRGTAYAWLTGKQHQPRRVDRRRLRKAVMREPYETRKIAKRFKVSITTVKRYRAEEMKKHAE